jgi:hypothetical protein
MSHIKHKRSQQIYIHIADIVHMRSFAQEPPLFYTKRLNKGTAHISFTAPSAARAAL